MRLDHLLSKEPLSYQARRSLCLWVCGSGVVLVAAPFVGRRVAHGWNINYGGLVLLVVSTWLLLVPSGVGGAGGTLLVGGVRSGTLLGPEGTARCWGCLLW